MAATEAVENTAPDPFRSTAHSDVTSQRLQAISAALAARPRSPARVDAILLAAEITGRSTRTVHRWIRRYEEHGLRGLARKRPLNAGQPRVWISRPFDRVWFVAGGSEEGLHELARNLSDALKGLWASRAERAGAAEIRRLAEFLLLELGEANGMALPREAHRLSRRAVERFAAYRVVNQKRNDRKAYDDGRPRIRRDWTQLAPMERVVADVKHLDVIVRRNDGSTTWPKVVAFLDAGTGRVFAHPVRLDRGEGVRQEHVIEAFLSMVADPAWGFPKGLYLDNGAEFGALAKIDGALQLLNEPGARTIIYAQPYNASAKPIESLFARLDRQAICMLPGYTGPNRLASKTQTLGRPPEPYPGSWVEFCGVLSGLIAAQNLRPASGLWANRSPDDWFRQKHAEGWRPATVDPLGLDAAFADHDSRRIDRGVIKFRGDRYTHPDLAAQPSRRIVDLAIPWRRDSLPMVRVNGAWVRLERERVFPARWIEGAHEAGRRRRAQDNHVRALAKTAPPIDPIAVKIRWAERMTQPTPTSTAVFTDLGSGLRGLGSALSSTTDGEVQSSSRELRRAREMAMTEILERELRSK